MTNRQWLLNKMQNMSDEELAEFLDDKNIFCEMIGTTCSDSSGNCYVCITNWLEAEHKEPIKLSDVERVILENIAEKFKWIARDDNALKTLYIYNSKPSKEDWRWNVPEGKRSLNLAAFNHLFQFIKWEDEQAYNIAELLKGE